MPYQPDTTTLDLSADAVRATDRRSETLLTIPREQNFATTEAWARAMLALLDAHYRAGFETAEAVKRLPLQ